jgi:Fic family protein
MNLSKFGEHKAGTLVEVNVSSTITHAFLPDFLPPRWEIPRRLWPLVAEARAKISKLDGIGTLLPNPNLFIHPLQHREAQASSQLEGTITPPKQQLLFEIDKEVGNIRNIPTSDLREVANYRQALTYFREVQADVPLSLWLLRQLHSILLDGVRGEHLNPGAFRDGYVVIGRPPRFVPPPPYEVSALLQNLESYFSRPCTDDPLVDAFILHYQFEAIHPFNDGNGRIGRLFLAILLAKRCGLKNMLLYMSAFFDANRDLYIQHLFNISTEGDWDSWIEFCLHGAIEQAVDTAERCQKLLDTWQQYRQKLLSLNKNVSLRLQAVVDSLFVVPVTQVTTMRENFDIDFKTAQRYVEALKKLGILEEYTSTRQKTYFCQEIINIIYEGVVDPEWEF